MVATCISWWENIFHGDLQGVEVAFARVRQLGRMLSLMLLLILLENCPLRGWFNAGNCFFDLVFNNWRNECHLEIGFEMSSWDSESKVGSLEELDSESELLK